MEEFLERLKQRKLVQWTLAYLAAAFALIQVLDVIAQRFGWPEGTMRIVIGVLGIGFFVAVVLAVPRRARRTARLRYSTYYVPLWSPYGKPTRLLPQFPEYVRKIGFAAAWDRFGEPDLCRKQATGEYACE